MAAIPPPLRVELACLAGCATAIYPPTKNRHNEPPTAPIRSRFLRPNLSIRKSSQMNVPMVLMTPKIPVVRREVLVPVTPMDLKTVGE